MTQVLKHTDADATAGLAEVARVLGLPEPPAATETKYYVGYWSDDVRLAVSLPWTVAAWECAARALKAEPPEATDAVESLREDFLWMLLSGNVKAERPFTTLTAAVEIFLDEHRENWQPAYRAPDPVLFSRGSDVNFYHVLWRSGDRLNYLGNENG